MEPAILHPAILYEDADLIVLSKPAGLQVHAAKISASRRPAAEKDGRDARPLLTEWLLGRYPEMGSVGDDPSTRPGIVHRLDKETSGIMVAARNQKTFLYLKELFRKHEIKKTYLAIVMGMPKKEEGVIDAPIGILNGTLKRSVHSPKMAKEAVTEYKVVRPVHDGGAALLEVRPRTGRTHQIRVHLASIGHPIAGDRLYGPKKQPPWADRLMLHALSLEFTTQEGKRMRFAAEAPF